MRADPVIHTTHCPDPIHLQKSIRKQTKWVTGEVGGMRAEVCRWASSKMSVKMGKGDPQVG